MTIALLCPTRNRSTQFERMSKSVTATVKNDEEVIIYSGSNGGDDYATVQFPLDCPTVYMWNQLASQAMKNPSHKLFMLAADDTMFTTPCWDEALINHYNTLENKIHVYALQDSRDPEGTPHPIVTREWIEAMGYLIPPIFLHWWADTWTVDIAKANNCFTHLKDYMLIHDKPSDHGKQDETHTHIRSMGWNIRDQYVANRCDHYLEVEKQRLAKAL